MGYYPVFLELEGMTVLVIGGGKVAERKIAALRDCGANILLISKELNDKLKVLIDKDEIEFLGTEFNEEALDKVFLVVAATDDFQLNHQISLIARKKGLLVNAVDQPSDCNFIVPSVVRSGDLMIAISTSGKSPALAKKIRKELETQFGKEYEIFLTLMGFVREQILSLGYQQEENSKIFNAIIDSNIFQALSQGDLKEVESILRHILPGDIELGDCMECVK